MAGHKELQIHFLTYTLYILICVTYRASRVLRVLESSLRLTRITLLTSVTVRAVYSMSQSERADALPPDDALGQPGEGSCQFVGNVLGKVLDPSSERHHHEAVLRRVVHPCLKILKYERQTMRAKNIHILLCFLPVKQRFIIQCNTTILGYMLELLFIHVCWKFTWPILDRCDDVNITADFYCVTASYQTSNKTNHWHKLWTLLLLYLS